MTVAFPDIGAPARLRWRLLSNTQVGQSPLSKSVQSYELPGARWGFTAEWPPLEAEQRRLMRAFLAELGGQAGRFTMRNWEQPAIAGSGLLGKYGALPGSVGNGFSTPDSAAVSITGDIDIRVKVAMNDWTPAGFPQLVNKSPGGGNYSYQFDIVSDGSLRFVWSTDGTSIVSTASTLPTGFVDGSTHWVRATLDVNYDGAGSPSIFLVQFYTSEDGTTWTQLGANITGAGSTSIFNSAGALEVGAAQSAIANNLAGRIHYAEIRNGIDGTVVAEFDPSDWSSGTTWVSDTGETWTVNSSGSPSAGIAPIADATVRGASQTGNGLDTQDWKPNATGVLLPGDYFGVNGELKIVTAQVDPDNYGNATISFRPPLRSSPSDGAVIDLDLPEAEFMLTGPDVEWSVQEGNLFADFVIDAVEAF